MKKVKLTRRQLNLMIESIINEERDNPGGESRFKSYRKQGASVAAALRLASIDRRIGRIGTPEEGTREAKRRERLDATKEKILKRQEITEDEDTGIDLEAVDDLIVIEDEKGYVYHADAYSDLSDTDQSPAYEYTQRYKVPFLQTSFKTLPNGGIKEFKNYFFPIPSNTQGGLLSKLKDSLLSSKSPAKPEYDSAIKSGRLVHAEGKYVYAMTPQAQQKTTAEREKNPDALYVHYLKKVGAPELEDKLVLIKQSTHPKLFRIFTKNYLDVQNAPRG